MSAAGEPVRTLRIDLAYEGTRYYGFGLQPNRLTIQEVLEKALARSLGERVRVTAAGRTDAGVHASGQVVSFTTGGRLTPEELLRAANAHLPEDVIVHGAAEAPPELDARRSALRRRYRYLIWGHRLPNVWWRRWAWHVPGGAKSLDLEAMDAAARQLLGSHDFASFLGHGSQESAGRTTVRTVEHVEWWQDGDLIGFEITANAFLRHMVRGIVGTLIEVGRGRIDPAQFGTILGSRDRRRAGPNAPPHGLILTGVEYPEHLEAAVETAGSVDEQHQRRPGPVWSPGDRSGRQFGVVRDVNGGRRATGVS
jgi:tRNA pseudouridine38-40 synthase